MVSGRVDAIASRGNQWWASHVDFGRMIYPSLERRVVCMTNLSVRSGKNDVTVRSP